MFDCHYFCSENFCFFDPYIIFISGLQTKKLSKEPLAPIREKLRRQIIFFRCRRINVFYFIIIVFVFFLHFNISIILSCVYVSSFLDFISILINLVDDLGTKVHLKWERNIFSNLKYTVTKNCSLHRICTNIMDHKHHLATECSLGPSSVHAINVVKSFTHSVCFSSLVKCNFIGGVESCRQQIK